MASGHFLTGVRTGFPALAEAVIHWHMRRLVTLLALLTLVVVTAAGCGSDDTDPATGSVSGTTVDGGDDLRWGSGDHGVVLAHGSAFDAASWEEQATAIAQQGATVVAVEDTGPDSIQAAVEALRADGIEDVALVGGSSGADAILQLLSDQPDLASELILISPNSTVQLEGEQPKLFVASEDEGVADVAEELAGSAAGDDNRVELLPGSAHAQNIFDTDQGGPLLDLVLDRLAD